MTSSEPPPPGWYEDPENAAQSRWWTGTGWGPRGASEQTAEVSKSSSDPSLPDTTTDEFDSGTGPSDSSPATREEALNRAWTLRQEAIAVAETITTAGIDEKQGLENRYRVLIDEADAIGVPAPTRALGWHPDPHDEERLRYWDGADWDDDQQQPPDLSETEPVQSVNNTGLSTIERPFPAFALAAQGVVAGLLSGFRIWAALLFALLSWAFTTGLDTRINKPKAALLLGAFATAMSILVAVTFSGTEQPADDAIDAAQADKDMPLPDSMPDSNPAGEDQATESESSIPGAPDDVSVDEPAALDDLIAEALGSPNRDVSFLTEEPGKRVVLVENGNDLLVLVALNDNLSNRLIRSSAQRDTVRVAETMQQQADFNGTLTVSMYFPLVDQFGNAQETVVVTVSYTRDTLDRINFANLIRANIWDIADARQIHPTLQD